jgi:hypothetical protein
LLQELRISCAGSSHLSLEDPVFFEDAEAAAKAGSSGSGRSSNSLLGGGCAEVGGQVLLLLAQGCQQLRKVEVSGAPSFRAEVGCLLTTFCGVKIQTCIVCRQPHWCVVVG